MLNVKAREGHCLAGCEVDFESSILDLGVHGDHDTMFLTLLWFSIVFSLAAWAY